MSEDQTELSVFGSPSAFHNDRSQRKKVVSPRKVKRIEKWRIMSEQTNNALLASDLVSDWLTEPALPLSRRLDKLKSLNLWWLSDKEREQGSQVVADLEAQLCREQCAKRLKQPRKISRQQRTREELINEVSKQMDILVRKQSGVIIDPQIHISLGDMFSFRDDLEIEHEITKFSIIPDKRENMNNSKNNSINDDSEEVIPIPVSDRCELIVEENTTMTEIHSVPVSMKSPTPKVITELAMEHNVFCVEQERIDDKQEPILSVDQPESCVINIEQRSKVEEEIQPTPISLEIDQCQNHSVMSATKERESVIAKPNFTLLSPVHSIQSISIDPIQQLRTKIDNILTPEPRGSRETSEPSRAEIASLFPKFSADKSHECISAGIQTIDDEKKYDHRECEQSILLSSSSSNIASNDSPSFEKTQQALMEVLKKSEERRLEFARKFPEFSFKSYQSSF